MRKECPNRKIIKGELEEFGGTYVIDMTTNTIRYLLCAVEDIDDYYYVFLDGKNEHDRDIALSYSTCVGGVQPLKGVITDRNYIQLIKPDVKEILCEVDIYGLIDAILANENVFLITPIYINGTPIR